MKLQYKKVILFVLISTMGIGILTLSVAPNQSAKQTMSTSQAKGEDTDVAPDPDTKISVTPEALEVTLAPTATPIPTELPIYPLEEEGYPAITKFIKSYYAAKLDCDVDKLEQMFTNTEDIFSKKQLEQEVEFVEEFKKIKCYVKKGYEENTYIVFAYYEIKYYNIDTSVPTLKQFYLVTDADGNLKILSGEIDKVTQDYYDARVQDEDVQKLMEETNQKADEAKAKDATLKTFWENLEKVLSNKENNDAEE